MLRQIIPIIISLSVLAGCKTEQLRTSQLQESRHGVGGYIGAVRPIEEPVEVRIGEVNSYEGKIQMFSSPIEGSETSSKGLVSGSQVLAGGQFLHTSQINSLEDENRAYDAGVPLIKMEIWFDKHGQGLGEPGISFPVFEGENKKWAASSQEIKKIREKLKKQIATELSLMPKFKNYSQDDYVYSPEDFQKALDILFPGIVFDENTMSVRAKGITVFLGRPALVGQVAGAARVAKNNAEIKVSVAGHYVVDLRTGLNFSKQLDFRIFARIRSGETRNGQAIGSLKVTAATFPPPASTIAVDPKRDKSKSSKDISAPALVVTPFDGKWGISIKSNDARAVCSGFLNSSDIVVRDGQISGSITHTEAGYLELSGKIESDGKFKDVEAGSSNADVSLTGVLEDMSGSGKWTERGSDCEGTWTFHRIGPQLYKRAKPVEQKKPVKKEPTATTPSGSNIENSLRTLQYLFDKKLITPGEYQERRKAILERL